jgi:hypothetical protein
VDINETKLWQTCWTNGELEDIVEEED